MVVNRQYCNEVKKVPDRAADKIYIQDCLQSANRLIRSLNQRAQTILTVVSELVHQQSSFLRGKNILPDKIKIEELDILFKKITQ